MYEPVESLTILQPEDWVQLERKHRDRVQPWIGPRLARRQRGERHPVDDFLFEYYRLSPSQLSSWHPGWRHEVVGNSRLSEEVGYRRRSVGYGVDPVVSDRKRQRMQRAQRLLAATQDRSPGFSCFGLHEWAMVYRTQEFRHEQVPLRLQPRQIAATVDSVGLSCTHFDAYRFFTPAAKQLHPALQRSEQVDLEQPGCIHVGMDLYRFAYESLPLVCSELVADCFEFARDSRNLDMRSSPYDLSAWGFTPIAIETPEGRQKHAQMQRSLAERAVPLRTRLVSEIQDALQWVQRHTAAEQARSD